MKKLSKLYKLIQTSLDEKNVLIYQMGKVGSTTLEESLPNSKHFHTLYRRRCCQFLTDNLLPTRKSRIYSDLIQKVASFLYQRRRHVKIITLVRDPYERNLSHFFQDLHFWLCYHIISKRVKSRRENKELIRECFENSFNFDYARYWFKEEIERFTGIKIRDCDFDHVKGIGTARKGRFSLMVVRMDKLSNCEQEISSYVDAEVRISRKNVGDAKWYGSLYADFKKNYRPPDEVIEKSFDADWVHLFYDKREIAFMKDKAKGVSSIIRPKFGQ